MSTSKLAANKLALSRIGTTVGGKYRLDRIVGRGGMGVVYEAKHIRLERRVAVKYLHPNFAHDAGQMERFFAEARAASRLEHPNVVDVTDLDIDESGAPYMVLEFLQGESLAERLDRRGPLDPDEFRVIFYSILSALEAAHQAGIIHRDLKPDNIFLAQTASGCTPKVLDFGVAKLLQADGRSATRTGAVLGTPVYMSPEQAMGTKEVVPESDLWSIGVVAFEALTGKYHFAEFDAEDLVATAVLVTLCTNRPRSLRDVRPDLPEDLHVAIDACLAQSPRERPSAGELAHMLAGNLDPSMELGATIASELPPRPSREVLELPSSEQTLLAEDRAPTPRESSAKRTQSIPPPPGMERSTPGGLTPSVPDVDHPSGPALASVTDLSETHGAARWVQRGLVATIALGAAAIVALLMIDDTPDLDPPPRPAALERRPIVEPPAKALSSAVEPPRELSAMSRPDPEENPVPAEGDTPESSESNAPPEERVVSGERSRPPRGTMRTRSPRDALRAVERSAARHARNSVESSSASAMGSEPEASERGTSMRPSTMSAPPPPAMLATAVMVSVAPSEPTMAPSEPTMRAPTAMASTPAPPAMTTGTMRAPATMRSGVVIDTGDF